jgi:hypothetical protein
MAYLFHLKRMRDSSISFHPKEAPNFYLCDHCGEEAIVVPDPRALDSSTYCFCCFSRYEVNYCPMCEAEVIDFCSMDPSVTEIQDFTDFNNDNSSEEEDWPTHWGFCENCLDRISASP